MIISHALGEVLKKKRSLCQITTRKCKSSIALNCEYIVNICPKTYSPSHINMSRKYLREKISKSEFSLNTCQ